MRLLKILSPVAITLIVFLSGLPSKAMVISGLVAHRAVYEIDLIEATDRAGIRAMKGRIVYEIIGSRCAGYAVSFRFVTRIETGHKAFVTDQRTTTFEASDGKKLTFSTSSYVNEKFEKEVTGTARRADNNTEVELSKPDTRNLQLGKSIFMTEHLSHVIEKARLGEKIYSVDVFDGSGDGDELMATTTVIGSRSVLPPSDDATQISGLKGIARWPVSISYFSLQNEQRGEDMPVYLVSFFLYENGVSGDLEMRYEDYSLSGKLSSLEILPSTACE